MRISLPYVERFTSGVHSIDWTYLFFAHSVALANTICYGHPYPEQDKNYHYERNDGWGLPVLPRQEPVEGFSTRLSSPIVDGPIDKRKR